ncbi:MAG: class I SAM-dependent methyltransferase [Verrucomicrobiota bacterium]
MTGNESPQSASGCSEKSLKARLEGSFGSGIIEGSSIAQEAVLRQLLGFLSPRRVLEIGTRQGISAALFAEYADEVLTVDIEKSPDQIKALAREVWKYLGISERVKPYLAKGEVGWQYNGDKKAFISEQDFDFAFIDGNHTWRDVQLDFQCVRKCGCVLFHDYKPATAAYRDCRNTRMQDVVDVIDSLRPRAYLIGSECSQMAMWLARDSPHRLRPEAAGYLKTLPRTRPALATAQWNLLQHKARRRWKRLRGSIEKRIAR